MSLTTLGASTLIAAALAATAAPLPAERLTFDADQGLPAGWRAAATGGRAADWRISRDARALSPPQVLTIERLNDTSRGNFNLLWSPQAAFRDGSIEVSIRAISGEIDRGGGLIWRARDTDNYYLARYNPLERNLRLYYVKGGVRRMLADAANVHVGRDEWFTLKVIQRGARIEAWLNGERLIATTDTTFADAGGVGVWTKADANSAFDNLTIRRED